MKYYRYLAVLLCGVLLLGGCGKETAAGGRIAEEVPAAGEEPGKAEVVKENNSGEKSGENVASSSDAGNLSAAGNGYEGTDGSGAYNYGEALQKSLLFYELQRSGALPEETRCNWRGDSCLNDGSDHGLDLSGGWYDAGDHVKFNLPMSYTAAILGWSVYEDREAYEKSGQLSYALSNIKWANDYFIKCHPEDDVYYYQVGNGSQDHAWWGPAELVEKQMERPSYAVTKEAPGSAVCGETAASLAICSILFRQEEEAYSRLCLQHAVSLYQFAEDTKSDAGYTQADGFYNSWSGFYDELSWAGAWLYLATGEEEYLQKAREYYPLAGQDYDWALCWDDVHIGAAAMLAEITGEKSYAQIVEKHLDYWTGGTEEGERITYTPQGLAWLDNWGSLRYATTTAFLASVYSQWEACSPDKRDKYWDFAVSQADYALGSTGFSYEIGFGDAYPVHPHHRTAQGSYSNNMNEPAASRHILYGALVGGPDASDRYTDEVSNYNNNEVACDYNAGFTGLLANLYSEYQGQTLKDFGAIEIPGREFFAEGAINVDGQDFVEIKAVLYNESAWPARAAEHLELRYFIDLSEVYAEGGDAGQIEITTNYMQSGRAEGLKVFDDEKHIYYLSVVFDDGSLYPGGQENYKKEIQVRMRNPEGSWENGNDPSFEGLTNGNLTETGKIAVYEDGELVYGSEPAGGSHTGQKVDKNKQNENTNPAALAANSVKEQQSAGAALEGSYENENLKVSMKYDGSNANSISGTLTITSGMQETVSLQDLEIDYYFSKGAKEAAFECYHAAVNGAQGNYTGLNTVTGSFSDAGRENADTQLTMRCNTEDGLLQKGDSLTISFCIHAADWSDFRTGTQLPAENIVVRYQNQVLAGKEP